MRLYRVRSGSEAELEERSYTIEIGVSLGNKWFTPERIVDLIEWSLPRSRDCVVVNVADTIHAINLEVSERLSPEQALSKARAMGRALLADAKLEAVRRLSPPDVERVVYTGWDDVMAVEYGKKTEITRSLYEKDAEFREAIHGMVRNYTSRKEIPYSDSDVHRLGHYIIEELPEVMCRVPIAGIACDAYVYPFDGELTRMVEQIQNRELFPKIAQEVLDTAPKVFLEVR